MLSWWWPIRSASKYDVEGDQRGGKKIWRENRALFQSGTRVVTVGTTRVRKKQDVDRRIGLKVTLKSYRHVSQGSLSRKATQK